jgi:adenosylcobinamide amidohydrolase
VATHATTDVPRPVLVWRYPTPRLVASTATVGGGIGERSWVLNVQVPKHYDRTDLDAHVAEVAASVGCVGDGVGLLTAASLELGSGVDGGASAMATVGITSPTWAADVDGAVSTGPGTINVVVHAPVRFTDAALLNLVATVTEAKAQALFERGVPATGTASDAVVVSCPVDGEVEPFGGPRSVWGARIARASHAAVLEGLPA